MCNVGEIQILPTERPLCTNTEGRENTTIENAISLKHAGTSQYTTKSQQHFIHFI